jgi:hypothetical protein
MKRILQSLIIAGACGAFLFTWGASTTQAQDAYWRNHWRWHNRVYRPYYYRYYGPSYYYNAPPVYSGPYTGSYNNSYYAPGTVYYGPGYYGSGVQVGPLTFGWW